MQALQGPGILELHQVCTGERLNYFDTHNGKYTATWTKDSIVFLHNATHSCIVIDQMRITNHNCRFHIGTTLASSVLARFELSWGLGAAEETVAKRNCHWGVQNSGYKIKS